MKASRNWGFFVTLVLCKTFALSTKEMQEAIKKIETYLNNTMKLEDDSILLLTDMTIEKEKYYVFFYNSKKYVETEDMAYALAGNAPVILNKETGMIVATGTAYPVEYYMEEYEKKLSRN